MCAYIDVLKKKLYEFDTFPMGINVTVSLSPVVRDLSASQIKFIHRNIQCFEKGYDKRNLEIQKRRNLKLFLQKVSLDALKDEDNL